jgi:pantoate--beta-alanine ligase
MSSRNLRLNPEERAAAAMINRQLAAVANGLAVGWPTQPLEQMALSGLGENDLLDPEYVQIFDGDTLLPYVDGDNVRELVVAAAVRCGPVRLIDNRIVDLGSTKK